MGIIMSKTFVTVCSYGSSRSDVEYVSAAVHVGNKVVAAEVYQPNEMTEEGVAKRACDLVKRHGAKGLLIVEDVCPVEFHENGSLVIRIADGKGRSLPSTYNPHENQ
jgi:hypothetical protein